MLFRREEIAARVAEIGAQISRDFAGEAILLVGVLKGAAVFLADLARSISVETTFDFVAISSYKGVKTTGAVRLIKDLDTPIGGRNVILVEDILDTGLTLVFLRKLLAAAQAKDPENRNLPGQAGAASGEDRRRLRCVQHSQPFRGWLRNGLPGALP